MPTWQREPDPWTLAALASVGRAVERRRRQLGWSMRTLAYHVDVAPSTILRLERGEVAASLLLVVRVARALGGLTIGTPEPLPPSAWHHASTFGERQASSGAPAGDGQDTEAPDAVARTDNTDDEA